MKIYNFPQEYEKKQSAFRIFCQGEALDAYECMVSAIPFNNVWKGRQRPIEQTEKASFLSLGNDGETTLDIVPNQPFESVTVRPRSKRAKVSVEGGVVRVTFPSVGQYVVEFDGLHRVLAVFINPEKDFSSLKGQKGVLYFAPGVYYLDERLLLEDGQTVFIDEGAVVYGSINAEDKKNLRVVGYGVLDNSRMKRQDALQTNPEILKETDKNIGLPLYFNRCENVSVEGITIVDSSEWSAKITGCQNVVVDNIKIIGQWRYNSDGCDFCNCVDATLKNSFIRTFDDCVTVKGFHTNREMPVERILVENCVLWCDWGRCLEVGAETCAPYMRDITFRNCDLLKGSDVMMDVQQGDSAPVTDVLFENIRIDYTGGEQRPAIQMDWSDEYPFYGETHTPALLTIVSGVTMWSHDDKAGSIGGVTFRDIFVTTYDGKVPQGSSISTREAQSEIKDVYLENVQVNGKVRSLQDLGVAIGGNVKNIVEL